MSDPTPARRIFWSSLIVLGLLAIPFLCTSRGTFLHSRQTRATADILTLVLALEDFASAHQNRYPADLHELFTRDALDNPWLVKFNVRMPVDGWGRAFVYEPPTEGHPRVRIRSLGSDGEPGGEGECADIDSDTLRGETH